MRYVLALLLLASTAEATIYTQQRTWKPPEQVEAEVRQFLKDAAEDAVNPYIPRPQPTLREIIREELERLEQQPRDD